MYNCGVYRKIIGKEYGGSELRERKHKSGYISRKINNKNKKKKETIIKGNEYWMKIMLPMLSKH